MPRAKSNGIEIEYECFGSSSDPTVLLVMGFTMQMLGWDERFCRMIAARGYHVVRFDNRDVGLSTKIDSAPLPNIGAIMAGDLTTVGYRLEDMARDAIGLLDALSIERAHVVGASMGGMIGQLMALDAPRRVKTLTSIMSSTGDPMVGQPSANAIAVLLTPPPVARAAFIESAVAIAAVIGSKSLPAAPDVVRERAGRAYDRAFFPLGGARQFAAILAAPDRTQRLRTLDVPTLVMHGIEDELIAPSGGEATARAIPGARLEMIEQMGHDLPEPLWERLVESIVNHVSGSR